MPGGRTPATGRGSSGVPTSGWGRTDMTSSRCPTTNMASTGWAFAPSTSGRVAIRSGRPLLGERVPIGIRLNESLILLESPTCLAAPHGHRLDQSRISRLCVGSARSCWRGRRFLRLHHAMAVNVTILLRIIDDRRIRRCRAGVSRSRRGRCRSGNARSNRSVRGIPSEALALRGGR